jgi:membrane-bound ClpP family serine protease
MEENKKAHLLDLKLPLGGLLSFYGLIMVVYGLLSGKEAYEKSLGINLNLFWGALILVIGAALLLSAFRKPRAGRR